MTNTTGLLALHLLAGFVCWAGVIAVWAVPAWMWPHSYWSKLAWSVASLWIVVTTGPLAWPVGALMAILRARHHLRRSYGPGAAAIPFAQGLVEEWRNYPSYLKACWRSWTDRCRRHSAARTHRRRGGYVEVPAPWFPPAEPSYIPVDWDEQLRLINEADDGEAGGGTPREEP